MTQTTRLEQELADALGLVQSVRAAVAEAGARIDGKFAKRLARVDGQLADLQEQVNELVALTPAPRRSALTARSRRLRDVERGALDERTESPDALDAVQALAGETAFALAQWKVVARLAKATGDKRVRKLAQAALPVAEAHLVFALDGVDRMAKREAAALAATD
jgi:hypothetical protein